MSAEESVVDKLKQYKDVIPYDDFSDLVVFISHNYNMSPIAAADLVYKHIGKLKIGSQEFTTKGYGKNKLWQGQNDAHGFGMRAPGDLAEPKSSFTPLGAIELVAYPPRTEALWTVIVGYPFPFPENKAAQDVEEALKEVLHEDRLHSSVKSEFAIIQQKYPSKERAETALKEAKNVLKEHGLPDRAVLARYCPRCFSRVDNLTGELDPAQQSWLVQKGWSPCSCWGGQDEQGQGPLQKIAFKEGDIVRVVKNTQAPWGAEYIGVIERINKDKTLDIRDKASGELQLAQPAHLLRNPLGEGRPDVRVQQKRVGDPPGLGEGVLPNGAPTEKREYPGAFQLPKGQEGKYADYPNLFYKEASNKALQEMGRVRRPSTGAKGIVLKINDSKPGDIDVLILWDEVHAGHQIFETDIGDVEPIDEEPTHEEIKKAKEHLEKHLKEKEAYDKSFQDKVKEEVLTKTAHCGPCTEIKMAVIRLLSDTNYKNPNTIPGDKLNQLLQETEEPLLDSFIKTLDALIPLVKDEKVSTKLKNDSLALKDINEHLKDKTMKADPPGIKKEAGDALYAFLLTNVVRDYGVNAAKEVMSYLDGRIATPSKVLVDILYKYNLVADRTKDVPPGNF